MKRAILFAAILSAAACDKEKITGCVTCRTESYEINTAFVPNESKSVTGSIKEEEACGDAAARQLIEKFTSNYGAGPDRTYTRYSIDTTRKNIIIQTVTRCEEK